jgi:hypothetical protein
MIACSIDIVTAVITEEYVMLLSIELMENDYLKGGGDLYTAVYYSQTAKHMYLNLGIDGLVIIVYDSFWIYVELKVFEASLS